MSNTLPGSKRPRQVVFNNLMLFVQNKIRVIKTRIRNLSFCFYTLYLFHFLKFRTTQRLFNNHCSFIHQSLFVTLIIKTVLIYGQRMHA